MTDLVLVAIIAAVPTTISSLGAVIGILNRRTMAEVKTNVNGNLMAIKNELAIVSAQNLLAAEQASYVKGMAEERERGRVIGDEKYTEGVNAEKRRVSSAKRERHDVH